MKMYRIIFNIEIRFDHFNDLIVIQAIARFDCFFIIHNQLFLFLRHLFNARFRFDKRVYFAFEL